MKDYSNSKIPRLFELMEERNIKAKEITEATGITAASFTDWGKKGSLPSPKKLKLLADFFNVPVEYLLGQDTDDDSEDKKLLIEIKRLDDSQKKHLLQYVKFLQSQNSTGESEVVIKVDSEKFINKMIESAAKQKV